MRQARSRRAENRLYGTRRCRQRVACQILLGAAAEEHAGSAMPKTATGSGEQRLSLKALPEKKDPSGPYVWITYADAVIGAGDGQNGSREPLDLIKI